MLVLERANGERALLVRLHGGEQEILFGQIAWHDHDQRSGLGQIVVRNFDEDAVAGVNIGYLHVTLARNDDDGIGVSLDLVCPCPEP